MKPYFSHDEGARNDPKLIDVMMALGHEGKSVYWDLVEMLYEQNGYLMRSQCKGYAFALRTHCDLILSLVDDFGLFASDGEKFWSETALRRIEQRSAKSSKAKESAAKRWATSERNANALPTQCEGNAIKVKERKGKEIKEEQASSACEQDLASPSPESQNSERPTPTARPAKRYRYDAAPVFLATEFHAHLLAIGYGHVEWGMYLQRIQEAARKAVYDTKKRDEEATNEQWKAFITTYLDNDKRAGRLLLTAPAPNTGSYAGPNPALQVNTTSANYGPERIAANFRPRF